MRRGRGKGKKPNASSREDHGSGEEEEEEEKIPAYKRRGRPQKPMKDDFEEEEIDDSITSNKQENERKRKILNGSNADMNEEEENGVGLKSSTHVSMKSTSTGFRQNGSRRKSKPRRAAEAVVE